MGTNDLEAIQILHEHKSIVSWFKKYGSKNPQVSFQLRHREDCLGLTNLRLTKLKSKLRSKIEIPF